MHDPFCKHPAFLARAIITLLAMIPMIWLKLAVDQRNSKLKKVFGLLNDERHSTFMVNILVTLGVVVPIVTLLAQTGLAWLYMRYGHPWSRILKAVPKATDQPTEIQWRNIIDYFKLSCT